MTHSQRFFPLAKAKKISPLQEIKKETKLVVEEQDIPFVPPNVSLDDLTDDGALMTGEVAAQVDAELKEQPDGRYSKGTGGSRFGLMRTEEKNFSIYYGTRHEGKALGEGSYGKVKSAQARDHTWLALKVQEKYDFGSEFEFLSQLGWAVGNVVQRQKAEDQPVKYSLLMKYVRGCDLHDFIKRYENKKIKVHPLRWLDILIQFFEQLDLIHDANIIHADLKPRNIFYDVIANRIMIGDFGFALKTGEDKTVVANICGTPAYVAPELIDSDEATGKSTFSVAADLYSAGRVLKKTLGIPDTLAEYKKIAVDEKRFNAIIDKPKEEKTEQKTDEVEQPDDYKKEWQNKPFITNRTPFSLDRELNTLARALTHDEAKHRPSSKEVVAQLKEFRRKAALSYPVNVGILHFGHLQKLNKEGKAKLLEKLKRFDEIVLIDNKKYLPNAFKKSAEALRWLLDAGVTLRTDKILVSSAVNELLHHIPGYFREQDKKDGKMRRYFQCVVPYRYANLFNNKGKVAPKGENSSRPQSRKMGYN